MSVQRLLELPAAPGEGIVEVAKPSRLGLAEAFDLSERQPPGELLVAFDLVLEEVADQDHEERQAR